VYLSIQHQWYRLKGGSAEANLVLTARILGRPSQAGRRAIIDVDQVLRMSSPLARLNRFLAQC
jgi:hypothetical protein